jgi:sugar phosphate isomerase/epimerase
MIRRNFNGKAGLVTDILGYMPFEEMLDTCVDLGVEALELGCGNWSKAPHVDLDGLLESAVKRAKFSDAIKSRGLEIAALNCSGNQLEPTEVGEAHKAVVEKTFQLAGLLGVETIVMMSGCPSGGPNDVTPNWLTHPILPPHFETVLLGIPWDFEWASGKMRGCGTQNFMRDCWD